MITAVPAEAERPVLLISSERGIVELVQSIFSNPTLVPGLIPQVVLYHAPTEAEAVASLGAKEFILVLVQYFPDRPADFGYLKSFFSRPPIILIVDQEDEAEAVALVSPPLNRAQDYLLRDELTESVLRRLVRPAHLFVQTRRRLQEMLVLNTITILGSEATQVSDLLFDVTRVITNSLYREHFGFIMRDENGRWRPHHAYHTRRPLELPLVLDEKQANVGWVAENGRPRRIQYAPNEPDYLPLDPQTLSGLSVPLLIQGKTIGVINAESARPQSFSQFDEQLLMTLTRQLATVTEKINLLGAERRRRHEAETLRDIMTVLSSTLDYKQVLEQILLQLDKVVPNDTACVTLKRGDCLQILAAHGFDEPEKLIGNCFPADDPFFLEVQRTRQSICLTDVSEHPGFKRWGGVDHIHGWICAPLIAHDQVLGVLTVDNRRAGAYTPDDVTLVQAFANQAAVAIENARLYEAEQQERRTAEILRTANEALTQSLDQDTVLQTLIVYLVQLVPVDSASVLLLDESGEYARLYSGWGFERWGTITAVEAIRINVRTNRTLSPIFTEGQYVLIDDTEHHPHWERFPATHYVRSWLGVPIMVGGQVFGAFSLDKATPHFFTEEHLSLVQTITTQAAVALQNAHLFAETERRAADLEALRRISADLRVADSLEEMLAILLQQTTAVTTAIFSSIYLLDQASGDLTMRQSIPPSPFLIGHRHRLGEGITGHVALSGEPYICQDVRQSPYYKPLPFDDPLLQSIRATISLPLKTKNRVIGVMHFSVEQSHEYTRGEINLLTAISEIGASALERAMLLETLEQRVAQRTRELAEAYEQLQELDRLKTKFVSDVSHELRTPITNLSLYVDLLAQGRPERQAHYQAVLRQQVDRLNTLIEDTLHISRLDMGRVQMRLISLNLNDLVQTCVTELTLLAERSGQVRLTAVLQPNLPPIRGDREQLHIVVQNLLKNAIDYTSEGRIEVTTSTEREGFVCLKVADTGMGIADDDLPHLFKRFYRGTAVAQSTLPGTGLGLAIVKEIVEQHQGRIEVASQPGEGATFTVCLPLVEQ